MANKKRTSFSDSEKYLTMYDVADYTSLSYDKINQGIKNGTLHSIVVGNKKLFKKEWVDKWLEGNDE